MALTLSPLFLDGLGTGRAVLMAFVAVGLFLFYVVATATRIGSLVMAIALGAVVLWSGTAFLLFLLAGPPLVYLAVMKTRPGVFVTGLGLIVITLFIHASVSAAWEAGSSTAGVGYVFLPILQWPLLGLAVLFERIWLWGEGEDRDQRGRLRDDKPRWHIAFTRDHVALVKERRGP